ncbi:hypothetical protein [Corynebacterium frankenforstense]
MRVAAVTGGLIVVAGLMLLLALAIQRGWLGPMGRVIVAYLAALALLPAAVAVDRRNRDGEKDTAVTALSVTSYGGVHVTTLGVLTWLDWWPESVGCLIAVFTFSAYLVIAVRLRWPRLLIAMAVIAPPLTWLFGDYTNFLLPLLWLQGAALFLVSVFIPRFDRPLRAAAAASTVLCLVPVRTVTANALYPLWVPVAVILGLGLAFLTLRRRPANGAGPGGGVSVWWFSAPLALLVMGLLPPGSTVPGGLSP